jgi:hypothetical protein
MNNFTTGNFNSKTYPLVSCAVCPDKKKKFSSFLGFIHLIFFLFNSDKFHLAKQNIIRNQDLLLTAQSLHISFQLQVIRKEGTERTSLKRRSFRNWKFTVLLMDGVHKPILYNMKN